MKAYTMVIGTALLATASLSAKGQTISPAQDRSTDLSSTKTYERAYIDRAVRNYCRCLESKCSGVVESALAHVAYMKLILPATDCGELGRKIDLLTSNGATPAIRYKAYITRMLFDNPGMFVKGDRAEFQDTEEIFSSLARRLQENLLGYNAQ